MNNTSHTKVKWFYILPVLTLLALVAGVLGGRALAGAPASVPGAAAGSVAGPTQAPTNTPCPRGTPFVFQINIVNMSYLPPQAFFPAGTRVRWTNLDNMQHSATSDNNLWDSGPIAPGQSFEFLIQNPGPYNYHDSFNQQLRGSLNVGNPPPCGPPGTPGTPPPTPPRTGTPQGTPPRTGTPPATPPRTGTPPATPPRTGTPPGTPPPPPRTGTPQGTPPPPPPNCQDCHMGILAVTNSCNPMDGTVHWISIVHNPDRCVVRAPWRAELQVEENGKWHAIRTQFATFNFPPGDGVIQGVFCFQAAPNVHALRVEFMFQPPPGGVSAPEVREVISEPDRYSDTPSGQISSGSGKDTLCNMHMAAHPIPPCPRTSACPPPPPPPGTPPAGTPPVGTPRPTFTPTK